VTPGVAARFCYGTAIVALLLVEPGGLAGLGRRARRRLVGAANRRPTAPGPPPGTGPQVAVSAAAAAGDSGEGDAVAAVSPAP
jgi:branched-chain amino acid transport system permease protein